MMTDWEIIASGQRFPEGPVFAPDGTLWWVEIEGGGFGWHRDGRTGRIATGGRPNGAAVGPDGLLWFCDQGECSIRTLDPVSEVTRTILSEIGGQQLGRPNDLLFDAAGNLLFTCPNDGRTDPWGYVCCLSPDGVLTVIADGMYFANGLALLPDGRLVVAETYRQRLLIGAWDPAARMWHDPQPWLETGGPIGPDGLATGEDRRLYIAVFGQGVILAADPDGRVVDRWETPGSKPTNCCLDPRDPMRLIVTDADHELVIARKLCAA
jgi:gluconolactonase